MLGNLTGKWSQTSIYQELAAFISRNHAMFLRQPSTQPQFCSFSKLRLRDPERFSLYHWSQLCKLPFMATSCFDSPWCKAINCWHSVEAHIHDQAGSVLLPFWPIMAANIFSMYQTGQISDQLPDIQDQKSLTLHWCPFSWSGSESVAFFWAYKGGQNFHYASKRRNLWAITSIRRQKIVDAPLTLIVIIRQGECCFLFGR